MTELLIETRFFVWREQDTVPVVSIQPASDWPSFEVMGSAVRGLMVELDVPGVNVMISAPDRNPWVARLGDLDRWIESRSISPSLHEERMRFGPIPGSDDRGGGWGYGFGVANFGRLIVHNGGIPGFQSFASHMPGTGANIIVLANINTGPGGKVPADTIAPSRSH